MNSYKYKMSKIILALSLVIAITTTVEADKVVVGGIPYAGVNVIRIADCRVTFAVQTGRQITKNLSEVTSLTIDNEPAFNNAENLLKKGQAQEALAAYEDADRISRNTLIKSLIRYRRLEALDQAGYIDEAVELWLEIVKENNASKESLALRPSNTGPKGSSRNNSAIKTLRKRLKDAEGALAQEIKALLEKLSRVQGQQPPRGDTTGKTNKGSDEAAPGTQPIDVQGDVEKILKAAEGLISNNRPEQGLEQLKQNIKKFDYGQLPRALLLMGKAQRARAELASGEKADELLYSAGLNYMKVVAHFPNSPEAPQALYLAGKVNASFSKPNIRAAKNAFNMIIERYDNSDFAAKAKQSLASLKVSERE